MLNAGFLVSFFERGCHGLGGLTQIKQKIKIRENPCHPRNPCSKAFCFDAAPLRDFNFQLG